MKFIQFFSIVHRGNFVKTFTQNLFGAWYIVTQKHHQFLPCYAYIRIFQKLRLRLYDCYRSFGRSPELVLAALPQN